ncbi:MAG: LptF/LptG family permease, partial [Deltaproteobacteria bacterium]|nr:LptF/LptG family permease [Deltaproteobacteria bacterium]
FNDLFDDVVIYAERFDLERQVIKGILISDKRDPASPVLIVGEQAVIIADPLDKRIKVQLANGTIHRQESGSGSYQQIAFSTYEMDVDLTKQGGGKRRIKYREMDLGALRRLAEDTPPESGAGIRMKAELHKRFAFPFACLVFGLIGMPLGIFWSRGGRAYGFMASIVVVFCYYLLLNVGESLAKSATVP